MAQFVPVPDPSGSLDPPRRPPPTALGAATPDPEPIRSRTASRGSAGFTALRQAAVTVLEIADEVAASLKRVLARN